MQPRVLATVLSGAFMLLAVVAVAAEGERTLVLYDGTTIRVAGLELNGGMVLVHLSQGRAVAYDAADVNLEASGLLPETNEQEAAAAGSGGSEP